MRDCHRGPMRDPPCNARQRNQVEPETDRRRSARMEVDLAKKSGSTAATKPKPVVIVLDEAEPDTLRPSADHEATGSTPP
jgi:hypothetical protein